MATKSKREIGDVVFDVIQRDGRQIFAGIIRRRATSVRALPSAVSHFAGSAFERLTDVYREIRSQGIRETSRTRLALTVKSTKSGIAKAREIPSNVKSSLAKVKAHYQTLPTPRERTEFVLMLALYSASYLGGVFLGFQIPKRDLRIFHKRSPKSLVTLYSAPLLTLEIALEWMKTVLQTTLSHPEITDEDRKALLAVEKVFVNLSGGVATGAAASEFKRGLLGKRGLRHAPVGLALNDDAYRLVEEVFNSLVGEQSTKKPA